MLSSITQQQKYDNNTCLKRQKSRKIVLHVSTLMLQHFHFLGWNEEVTIRCDHISVQESRLHVTICGSMEVSIWHNARPQLQFYIFNCKYSTHTMFDSYLLVYPAADM